MMISTILVRFDNNGKSRPNWLQEAAAWKCCFRDSYLCALSCDGGQVVARLDARAVKAAFLLRPPHYAAHPLQAA